MARAETIEEKPAFRAAFRARRCALIADGFYEWQRAGTSSSPFYFRFVHRPTFIAGIWERWRDELETCAVVTTVANDIVSRVHDRMPVLLDRSRLRAWLKTTAPMADVRSLLSPSSPLLLRVFPANRAVNNPANDSPSLMGDYEVEARLFGESS